MTTTTTHTENLTVPLNGSSLPGVEQFHAASLGINGWPASGAVPLPVSVAWSLEYMMSSEVPGVYTWTMTGPPPAWADWKLKQREEVKQYVYAWEAERAASLSPSGWKPTWAQVKDGTVWAVVTAAARGIAEALGEGEECLATAGLSCSIGA